MKKILFALLFAFLILTACSSNDSESANDSDTSSGSYDGSAEESAADRDMGFNDSADEMIEGETAELQNESPQEADVDFENAEQATERKVIYTADLRVEVNDYEKTISNIQKQVTATGGYVVESHTYGGDENELKEGMVQVRVPQEHFQSFLEYVESGSMDVLERSVSGQDVTEEFVDLKSRLKSKRVVEERLLSFMEGAEKTEDLLKISNDLAKIQEEIEQITGRMNYLQNKADLATVSIYVVEDRVNIPKVNEENLNTWEKTQQQFMESINFLISAASGLFVFFGGSLPILILLAIIGLVVYGVVKKRIKPSKSTSYYDPNDKNEQ
ncbi:DUF4349 domain-containing protein [Radiobacillus sp. PE A8.2]|uniref:DUF4349 domain-containing protein n=1 Tax=Radiobacillus sp. PE A8.2 TaxID=3380349 RepID=UPI003890CE6D